MFPLWWMKNGSSFINIYNGIPLPPCFKRKSLRGYCPTAFPAVSPSAEDARGLLFGQKLPRFVLRFIIVATFPALKIKLLIALRFFLVFFSRGPLPSCQPKRLYNNVRRNEATCHKSDYSFFIFIFRPL